MKFVRPDECGPDLELAVLRLPYSVGQSCPRTLSDSRGRKSEFHPLLGHLDGKVMLHVGWELFCAILRNYSLPITGTHIK